MYTSFLELCGFTPNEIRKELPRVKKAFGILKIEPEDVKLAEKRIQEIFDINLEGIRKILSIWIKELLALVLAKEEKKKIVYAIMPSPAESYTAAMLASEDLYVGYPDYVLQMTMGALFNKLDPILEAGEKMGMGPGGAHCGLNKTRLGAHALGIISRGDLSLAWGIACDEGPKTDELIHEIFGMPVQYINRSQDSDLKEFPRINPRALEYLTGEIRRAYKRFGEVAGVKVTPDLVMKAIKLRTEFLENYNLISEIMRTDPIPLSQADFLLFHMITSVCIRDNQGAIDAARILYKELKQRVEKGIGVVKKGAPRVLWGNHTPVADPSITKMVENLGLAVPVSEIHYLISRIPTKVFDDPIKTVANRFFEMGITTSVTGRISDIINICKDWNLDGVFWFNHFPCRLIGTDAMMIKKAVKDQLDIPMLILEGEMYDTRIYNAQQMKTRVETFAQMLKMTKATKGKE